MTELRIVFVEDEEVGEVQGMFDMEGNLLGAWSDNDASWRNEYFSPFLEKLGIIVEEGDASKADIKKIRKWFGV
jgi:hypothetical protein